MKETEFRDLDLEGAKIANRRHDDVVLIIRHDFFPDIKKNNISIEYLNDFGLRFFSISQESFAQNDDIQFFSILSQKTKQLIKEELYYHSEDNFARYDLAKIIRKISNFSMLDHDGKQTLVSLKIFYLKEKKHIFRKRDVISNYYYLIIRNASLDMKMADYRLEFLEKIGNKISLNDLTNVHDLKSTIDELKMVIKYQNSHKNIDICVGLIELNNLVNDNALIYSIVNYFVKNTRIDDFIGHFGDNKLIVIFYDLILERAQKPLQRLYNIIMSDEQISTKYKNHRDGIIRIGLTKLEKNDDLQRVEERLNHGLEKAITVLDGPKIGFI
jgi:hypothetical protein